MKKILFSHTLKQLFLSQTAWWLAAAGLLILSTLTNKYIQDYLTVFNQGAGITHDIAAPIMKYTLLYFMVSIPLICLQILGADQQMGMMPFLHTFPISAQDWVVGKYVGALSYFILLQVLFAGMFIFLFKNNSLDMGFFWANQVALFLMNASLLSIGFLISSLFKHATLAIALQFIVGLALFSLPWFTPALAEVSFTQHLFGLLQGQLNTIDIGFFVLITAFALCCSVKLNRLETRSYA